MTSRRLPLRPSNKLRFRQALPRSYHRGSHLRFVGLFFGLVFLITALAVGLCLHSQRVWDGEHRVTFVLQAPGSQEAVHGVFLVSYLPGEQTLTVVTFPKAMKIEAIGGFGSWNLASIYGLGELQKKRGGELLTSSLSEFLGVAVDGWVTVESGLNSIANRQKSVVRKAIWESMVGKGQTNFSLWDLARLWGGVGRVRPNGVETVDLAATGILTAESLPDGSEAFSADPARLDRLCQRLLSYPELSREGLTIAVLNSTAHAQLGNRAARLLRNIGADVVSVGDSERHQEETTLVLSDPKLGTSFTVKITSRLFGIRQIAAGETSSERADMLLVVGEDYWQRFTEF